jgi:hypothetical protein
MPQLSERQKSGIPFLIDLKWLQKPGELIEKFK